MQTKQETSVSLAVTDRVSMYDWKGVTRVQFNETNDTVLEVSNVDTGEMLLAISYYVGGLAKESGKNERTDRILRDMLTSLQESLQTTEEVAQ